MNQSGIDTCQGQSRRQQSEEAEATVSGNPVEPLAEETEEIFGDNFAQDKVDAIQGLIVSFSSLHKGPLPDAGTIAAYSKYIPDGGERVMVMAERAQLHRMQMEQLIFKKMSNQHLRGQWMGFIVTMIFVGAGAFLIHGGHDGAGTGIIGISMVAVVALFVTGKRKSYKEKPRNEK